MLNVKHHLMATEAVAHQDKRVFKRLVEALRPIMSVKGPLINDKLIEREGLAKIIHEEMGIKTTVKVSDDIIINAYVQPPVFDASHALWNLREYINSPENTKYFIDQQKKSFKDKKFITGVVDRENAKISGDFSEIECPIWLTRGLLSHPKATPEIAAAIILHECGHVFTFFEHLGRVNTFNGALQAASERFFKAQNQKDKIRVIADVGDMVDLSADDKEVLLMAQSKEQFITVIARSFIPERNSTLGSQIYDMTLWESLSDQFAARMCPSAVHVESLDLIYSQGTGRHPGIISHLIFSLIGLILFSFLTIMTFGLSLIILFINPAEKIYDEPRARMQRIRNDIVQALKAPGLTKQLRAELLNDIKRIDEIMAKVNDYRGILELFYTSILPSGRREYTQLLFQRELEKLVANDLVVSSAKLNNLSLQLS